MNPLAFRCPKTDRKIDIGIDIDYPRLQCVQPVTFRLMCPHCARPHTWKLADGTIEEPRESSHAPDPAPA